MALFACVWALVEGYYRAPNEVFLGSLNSNLASFLLIYIGALLILDASSSSDQIRTTVPLQSIALLLLLFIVIPKDLPGLDADQLKILVSFAFDLAATISIALGTKGVSSARVYVLLLLTLGCYVIMDTRHFYFEISAGNPLQLTRFELVAYMALKVIFTVIFGCAIAYHGMTESDRDRGVSYWIGRFTGLDKYFPGISQRPQS